MRRCRSALLAAACLVVAPSGCTSGVPCDGAGLCLSQEPGNRVALHALFDALAVADLDGDGHLDVVGASATTGALTVAWRGAAGAAASRTTWTIADEVAGVAIADLDGDGRLDLATALPGADAVAVLRSRGGRSFSAPERLPAGRAPRSLIAADLDGAGPLELVTADLAGTVTVLHDLAAQPSLVVGPGPSGLAAGDLDGDGDIDLAVSLASADAIQVLLGDGAGGLLPGPLHPVGAAPSAIVAADLDDDGALDLATADALDDTISVLLADGAGGHRPRRAFPTAPQPGSLVAVPDETSRHVLAYLSTTTPVVERLDPRDGTADTTALATLSPALALAPTDAGALAYGGPDRLGALSPGDGLRARAAWQRPDVLALFPVDLEDDGTDELVAVTQTDGLRATAVWRGDPDHAEPLDTGLFAVLRGALAADVTGDGRRDLVAWTHDELRVLVQHDDGTLVAGPRTVVEGSLRSVQHRDGAPGLLVFQELPDAQDLRWFTVDAAGALQPDLAPLPYDGFIDAYLVDGSGDATPDLFLQQYGVSSYHEDFAELRLLDLDVGNAPLDFADVDGDGALDILVHDEDGITLLPAVFTDTPGEPLHLSDEPCDAVALADLDGDGALDLLSASPLRDRDAPQPQHRLTPWLRRGDGWTAFGRALVQLPEKTDLRFARLAGAPLLDLLVHGEDDDARALELDLAPALVDVSDPPTDSPTFRHLADLDGDGADDLISLDDGLAVAFADGRGGLGPQLRHDLAMTFGTGLWIESSVVGDFDRDGADELVVALRPRRVHDLSLVRLSLDRVGDLSHELLATLPVGTIELHAADLDDDGHLDLFAFLRTNDLNGWLLRGDGRGRFAPPDPVSAPGGHPQLARLFDVDRDGHLDVLALDSPGGVLLFRGRGGTQFDAPRTISQLRAFHLFPGDFDHDGRTELAALNPAGLLLVDDADPAPRVLLQPVEAAATVDLDGDGALELVAVRDEPLSSGEDSFLFLGRPGDDGRLVFARQPMRFGTITEIEAGDIDGDGDLDLALIGSRSAEIVRQGP